MNSFSAIIYLTVFVHGLSVVATSSSSFPIELSISQEKRFFPHEISSFSQHVSIQIKTGAPVHTEKKLTHELFIVLDSSGSMAGANKWGNAISAIENIIQNMNQDDKLHLVQYNSVSSVVFENANDKKVMLSALKTVYPSGGTNLMAGFNQIIPLLKKYADRATIKRLFILSDGQINEGVTNHNDLLKEVTFIKNQYGVTICSFGIGYDFDEELMTNIADHGSGDYFFIEGAASMEKVIGIAYQGFQNLMSTNAYLKVTTKYDAEIVDVFGYEMKQDEEQIIPLGYLRYNDLLNVLLEMKVKISEELLSKDKIDYMIVELWMVDINDQEKKLVTTNTVLFSLSRNDEELKTLNEIVHQLVELKKLQRREKEEIELLRQNRLEEALKIRESLSVGSADFSRHFAGAKLMDADDETLLEYSIGSSKAFARRSEEILTSYTSSSGNSANLAKKSASAQRLNEKHRTSTDEL